MIYDEWKFYINSENFYYYRKRKDNFIIKVYPVFSLNLFSGPQKIISWNCNYDGLKISFKKEIDALFFVDMKLSEKKIRGIKMFNPKIYNYKKYIKILRKNYKLKNIIY